LRQPPLVWVFVYDAFVSFERSVCRILQVVADAEGTRVEVVTGRACRRSEAGGL
jgi:hypothetical protein